MIPDTLQQVSHECGHDRYPIWDCISKKVQTPDELYKIIFNHDNQHLTSHGVQLVHLLDTPSENFLIPPQHRILLAPRRVHIRALLCN